MKKYIRCDVCGSDNDISNTDCWRCGNKMNRSDAKDERMLDESDHLIETELNKKASQASGESTKAADEKPSDKRQDGLKASGEGYKNMETSLRRNEEETIILRRNRNTSLLSGVPMLLNCILILSVLNGVIGVFIALTAMFITNTALHIFLLTILSVAALLVTIMFAYRMFTDFRRIHKSNSQIGEILCIKGGKAVAYDIDGRMYSDVQIHRLTFANKFVFYEPIPGSNQLVCLGCHMTEDLPNLKPLINGI